MRRVVGRYPGSHSILPFSSYQFYSSMTALAPPICAYKKHVHEHHNDKREDGYHWLKDKKNKNVKDYLTNENNYFDHVFKTSGMDQLAETCYNEFLSRLQQTDQEVPTKYNDYQYYQRTEEGKNYKIYCRQKLTIEGDNTIVGDEEILLDLNEIARDEEYCELGIYTVSPSNNLLAYGIDYEGDELFVLNILDLTQSPPKLVHEELLEDIAYDFEWSADEKSIFYLRSDETQRPHQLWRHTLGTSTESDILLYEEDDEKFHVSLHKSCDERYLMLTLESIQTHEIRVMSAFANENARFRVFKPRNEGEEYSIEFHGEHVLLLTNIHDQKNFALHVARFTDDLLTNNDDNNNNDDDALFTNVDVSTCTKWTLLLAHNPHVFLEELHVFREFLVIPQRSSGLARLLVVPLVTTPTTTSNENNNIDTIHSSSASFDMKNSYYIEFPEPAYDISLRGNWEYDTHALNYQYSSFVTPKCIFSYNMATRTSTLLKQQTVLGNFDPSSYLIEILQAPADDGTLVPISLVRKKDLPLDGTAKCLLYGYGSYGECEDAEFSTKVLSFVDRDYVYAIAHVRGGGENGRFWYEDGKLLHKRHSFDDFICCAKYLIDVGYTSADRQAVYGGSAGGLLVTAAMNLSSTRLFSVAVAAVPFVDVLTTLFDESLPLTTVEWEEWGDPKDEEYYHYIKSYSPYDNIKKQAYPHLLITAGLNDSRVHYSEPAKFCAKLRTMKTDNNTLLLKTVMGAGHFGSSGRYDSLKEDALEYAFIIQKLNELTTKE